MKKNIYFQQQRDTESCDRSPSTENCISALDIDNVGNNDMVNVIDIRQK